MNKVLSCVFFALVACAGIIWFLGPDPMPIVIDDVVAILSAVASISAFFKKLKAPQKSAIQERTEV